MTAPNAGRRRPQILGVVSDLDGTLLRSDGTLSPASMEVLRSVRRLDAPLLMATARTPRGIRKVGGHQALGRVVCANGAVVWDAATDAVVSETAFAPDGLAGAVARLREALPAAGCALLSSDTMFVDETYAGLRVKGAEGAERFSDMACVLAGHRIVAVAVRHPRLTADRLVGPTSVAFGDVGLASFAGSLVVDVAPGTTTKAVAAAEEMGALGCPAATVVFGDMPNDLPLFGWAGWACAVANAHPDVLDAADEVVPSNDDDGVARTIQGLL